MSIVALILNLQRKVVLNADVQSQHVFLRLKPTMLYLPLLILQIVIGLIISMSVECYFGTHSTIVFSALQVEHQDESYGPSSLCSSL